MRSRSSNPDQLARGSQLTNTLLRAVARDSASRPIRKPARTPEEQRRDARRSLESTPEAIRMRLRRYTAEPAALEA